MGRSRDGSSTKIHLVADRRCRPIARLTSPGQHGDRLRLIPLRRAIRIARRGLGRPCTRPGAVMADKAHSSRANCVYLRSRGITVLILVKADQAAHRRKKGSRGGRPASFDVERYKQRNTLECCFSELRRHRAVATRYDNRERIYRGAIDVASIRVWLRAPVMEASNC